MLQYFIMNDARTFSLIVYPNFIGILWTFKSFFMGQQLTEATIRYEQAEQDKKLNCHQNLKKAT